ncbi:hypothetical protein [Nocardia abscessus]|uniref:hypothetical protein n=1 Tax=Nocardia abscessus TaxID=120957 RepID=UPI002453B626|nr:hypothetical protein [Nocardia abscessus]
MAVGRAFHVLAAACAVAGSALLGGAASADAQPPCPSCVADPAPPPYDSGDAWYPLTVPGQRSEISADSADSADPVAGTGSAAAGSAAGSTGLGVVLGSGSAGLGVVLGSGSAGLGVALGTGSAAVGSTAAGTGSAVLGTGSAALGTGSAVVGGTGSAALGTGSAVVGGTGSAAVGSAGIGSAGVGSAATGSAATGSAAVGSAAVGSASPLLLLLIPLPQATVPPTPALPPVTVPPVPAPAGPWISPIPIDAPMIPPAPAPDLAAPAPLREQPASPVVHPASSTDVLPAPRLLSVIGGLIALALAGVGSGVRARVLMRRIRPLHRVVVGRFPEVVAHEQAGFSTQLAASDQVAQIIDALYLQSGGGLVLAELAPPPTSVPERADRVARWARDPVGEFAVDARWIAPPEGISPRGWVQAIARAYRATASVAARN